MKSKRVRNNQLAVTMAFATLLSMGLHGAVVQHEPRDASTSIVVPVPYEGALRNPMKGFTTRGVYDHPWATLAQTYIPWNELENHASDGIEKIKQVSDEMWSGLEAKNVKVIPRVYLHWNGDKKYWPADMQEDDYSSEQFQARVLRLVERLGACWNEDPRVAFVELGIFGKWGEHHSPDPTPEMQQRVGEAFVAAFPDKKVSVRQAWAKFDGFGFGQYWDSWAHYDQMYSQGTKIRELVQDGLHLTNYVGGEAAYDWGNGFLQPGPNPTASVGLETHRDFIIHTIRWLHCTQLRWIEAYDLNDPDAVKGAEEIQKAFGYRYELQEVRFALKGNRLHVAFDVVNTGSAPFYYDWPVEISLLDPLTLEPVWKSVFIDADLRDWLPGSNWTEPEFRASQKQWPRYEPNLNWSDLERGAWETPPSTHEVGGVFDVNLNEGRYVLALAVLDPAGMVPSLRFATRNTLGSGRHPVGMVDLGQQRTHPLPSDFPFDDPADDDALHYGMAKRGSKSRTGEAR